MGKPAGPASWGPSSPSDPRIAAVLALFWRYGLFPTVTAAAFIFLLYSFVTGYTRTLEAIGAKLDAHQAAMDRSDAERARAIELQAQRLKGICYGVTEEGSRARAFCDE